MGIQVVASEGLTFVANHFQLGYAFGAGMVSAVNPCGFAMLPVYVSLYIGATEDGYYARSWLYRVLRALGVAAILTLGFTTLFGAIGVVVGLGGSFLFEFTPWIACLIGLLLVFTGIFLLLGKHFSFPIFLRFANRVGDPRKISITGFYLFGVAYGAASISCTLPIFLAVVMQSVTTGDFTAGTQQFANYILGVFSVLTILTVGIAIVKKGVVEVALRRLIPYVHTISALFLLVAGSYILYYWYISGLLFE